MFDLEIIGPLVGYHLLYLVAKIMTRNSEANWTFLRNVAIRRSQRRNGYQGELKRLAGRSSYLVKLVFKILIYGCIALIWITDKNELKHLLHHDGMPILVGFILISYISIKRGFYRIRAFQDVADYSDPNSNRIMDVLAQEADRIANGPREGF